jgi:hypothetical protein
MRDPKEALVWIKELLESFNIPYQIAGGLAANAYGSTRELVDIDIDIPQNGFHKILDSVKEYIIDGPSRYTDEHWDIEVMTLNYKGQEIDLSSIENVKIFNSITHQWESLETDLSKACRTELMGITVPVIPKNDLLHYKKILGRAVDLLDIASVECSRD